MECVKIYSELSGKNPNPNLYSINQPFSPVFCTNQNNLGFLANKKPNEYAFAYTFYYVLLSDSDCISNYCVQMFFSLYGFEENFLKYIVRMIDYVGQYGSFYLYQQETRIPYSTNRKKNRAKELLPKGKKPTAMLKKTHVAKPVVYKYITPYPTRELLIKRNIHHKGQGNGLDTLS